MEFYRIPCKVAAVGGVLEITCPENDCIIYRNLFRQYVDLRCDYYTGEDVLSETTKQLMTLHSRALGLSKRCFGLTKQLEVSGRGISQKMWKRYLDATMDLRRGRRDNNGEQPQRVKRRKS